MKLLSMTLNPYSRIPPIGYRVACYPITEISILNITSSGNRFLEILFFTNKVQFIFIIIEF